MRVVCKTTGYAYTGSNPVRPIYLLDSYVLLVNALYFLLLDRIFGSFCVSGSIV